jgi:SAM-dependent methyltransferase
MPVTLEPNTFIPAQQQIENVRARFASKPVWRWAYESLVSKVDFGGLERLAERHGRTRGFAGGVDGPLKSIDCAFWLYQKLMRAGTIGLLERRKMRVLDIGMGGGHFSLVCQRFGHDVYGLDIFHPVYEDVCALLGVRRIDHRVHINCPLPNLGGKFDIITAFATQFDLDGERLWDAADWIRFLERLRNEGLKPNGRVYFEINQGWDPKTETYFGKPYLSEVAEKFGGTFTRGKILDIRF